LIAGVKLAATVSAKSGTPLAMVIVQLSSLPPSP
jgi:hypothetical protein